MIVREALPTDVEDVWALLEPVIRAGDTYALPRDLGQEDAVNFWMGPDKKTYVVEDAGALVGVYFLKANQQGGGDHVCNCGYVTSEKARGRGVASRMCAHSLEAARALGFRAMQFNFVVATNEGAIRLWKRHGFEVIGVSPGAFNHPDQGYVDALVMHQTL